MGWENMEPRRGSWDTNKGREAEKNGVPWGRTGIGPDALGSGQVVLVGTRGGAVRWVPRPTAFPDSRWHPQGHSGSLPGPRDAASRPPHLPGA